MNVITANELKQKGIAALGDEETIVSFRGAPRYLVLPASRMEEWEAFRLEQALRQSDADVKNGRFSTDLEAHLREIDDI